MTHDREPPRANLQDGRTPGRFEITHLPKGIEYRDVLEQWSEEDDRGRLVIGDRRTTVALNRTARQLLDYAGPLPQPLSEVVHDVDLQFAVGQAMHDRRPLFHESYAPNPDRLLAFHIVPILGKTEEPLLAVVSIDDVTQLRHLETVRRDFVANVSHELRTPIASINLLVETLQRGAIDDDEAANHFLHRIEVETRAMAGLVEELLDLSRLESGRLTLNRKNFELRALFEDVLNRLRPAAREKNVDVGLEGQEHLTVNGDPKRVEQVLVNLVHNAIKFTAPGGTVTLRARRQGPGVRVEVVDTGVGLNPAEIARIFERFYKVDKGRSRIEGTGLGLAIARHLLELHGSNLQVVSEEHRGSTFSFGLPLAQ